MGRVVKERFLCLRLEEGSNCDETVTAFCVLIIKIDKFIDNFVFLNPHKIQ